MNSQRAKDKAINLMNEEGKEVTVEFLMNHLAVEDGNSQHRFLSQLDSSTSVNMVAYDRRQNKGKSNRSRNNNGREREQNKSRGQASSPTAQTSRKPPSMEGKCMRCGRPEHQQEKNVQPGMPSAKTATRLDTSIRYVSRARGQEEPI